MFSTKLILILRYNDFCTKLLWFKYSIELVYYISTHQYTNSPQLSLSNISNGSSINHILLTITIFSHSIPMTNFLLRQSIFDSCNHAFDNRYLAPTTTFDDRFLTLKTTFNDRFLAPTNHLQ